MDKAYILLNFDYGIKDDDNRFELVFGEYKFKATAVAYPSEYMRDKLFEAGWDICTYNNVPDETPAHSELEDMSEESLKKWDNYVRSAKERQEKLGIHNPTLWACRQNRWGSALEYAVRKNGYKIARGGGNDEEEYPFITDFKKGDIRTSPFEIFSHNIDEVKKKIDYAIEKKYALNIFTHLLVDTIEQDGGYDCLISTYREMLDYLKDKVDKGLCEVVTYKEFYEICCK